MRRVLTWLWLAVNCAGLIVCGLWVLLLRSADATFPAEDWLFLWFAALHLAVSVRIAWLKEPSDMAWRTALITGGVLLLWSMCLMIGTPYRVVDGLPFWVATCATINLVVWLMLEVARRKENGYFGTKVRKPPRK